INIKPQTDGLLLSGQTLALPAAVLAQLGAPFNTLQPTGKLRLQWPAMRLSGAIPDGELLNAEWRDATTALSLLRPLGTYRLKLTGERGAAVNLALSTASGPLNVTGQGRWTPRTGLSFQGTARPAPQASDDTVAALQST